MRLGILEMIGLAGTLIFAIPAAILGADYLAAGRPVLGGGLLVVAALMVLLPRYLTTPTDLPLTAAELVAGRAVEDDEGD